MVLNHKIKGQYDSLSRIDKIYVVNLDRSPNRYKYIKSELDKQNLGIKYERFSAFDGNQAFLQRKDKQKNLYGRDWSSNQKILNGEYRKICSASYNGGFFSVNYSNYTSFPLRAAGEFGCLCSHKKIWKDIVENNYKAAMVIEDDIKFRISFKEKLGITLDNLPSDADLLYLGHISSREKSFDNKYHEHFLYKVVGSISSTEGYIITAGGAKKLLAEVNSSEVPVDLYMSGQISNKKIIAYAAKPAIVTQSKSIKSDIGEH